MANQTIKASIVGLVLVGSMVYAPAVKAEYTPADNGVPKSGEDAGNRSFKSASDILKGCKTDADGNKVCPSDLGVVGLKGYAYPSIAGILEGCKKDAEGNELCPKDLGVVAEYTPDNNGSPKSGENAGSRS